MSAGIDGRVRTADVVVIGAGQAGLSAAYHLQRRGFVPAGTGPEARDPAGGPGPELHRPRRRGRPRRSLAPPLEEPPHGHRERHQRPARDPAARRRPGRSKLKLPGPLLRRLRRPTGAGHRTSRQGPVRLPGGQRRRRAAADQPRPAAAGRPGPSSTRPAPGPGRSGRSTRARLPSADGSCTLRTTSPRRSSAAGT